LISLGTRRVRDVGTRTDRWEEERETVEGNGTSTTTVGDGNGHTKIAPDDVRRLFEDGYREVEVLGDGTIRERPKAGDVADETVTKSLKTGRTWY